MSINRLLELFTDNVVFLLLVLPLIGAGLVVSCSRYGEHAVRRTALMNVLLSTLLGLLMVSQYDPLAAAVHQDFVQMESHLRWLGGGSDTHAPIPDIRIALGVDGVNLWFVFETVLLTLTAVLCRWGREGRNPAAYYALLLVGESALVGLFASQDIVLFCVCLELAAIPLFFLSGLWGGAHRRTAACRFFLWNLAGSLMILAGLAGVVVASGMLTAVGGSSRPLVTFSIPQLSDLIEGVPLWGPEALHYWREVSPWLFLSVLVGFAIKVPLFPFHWWLTRSHREADDGRGLLVCCLGTAIGCFGIARLVLPFFPDICRGALPVLSVVVISGVLLLSLLALTRRPGRDVVSYCMVAAAGLGLVGVCSLDPKGLMGGLLILLSVGASGGVLITQLPRSDAGSDLSGLPTDRWRRTIAVVGLGGLAFVPGLSGFGGLTLLVVGLFGSTPGTPIGPATAVAALIAASLLSIALFRAMRGAVDRVDDETPSEVETPEIAPLPLMLLVVMLGVLPQVFVDRMMPSAFETLRPYRVPVDENAESRAPKFGSEGGNP